MAKGNFNEVKAKPWKGNDLEGTWHLTLKVDGARMLRDAEGNPVSRSGKPLYNLENVPKEITDAEIYYKDWDHSMSLVRTSVNGSPVQLERVYELSPTLDPRLDLGFYDNPTAEFINQQLALQVSRGYEGLVIRKGDTWFKVKPKDTADVRVTGFQEGTGKHEGRMGALLTDYGKIGTGFTDEQRNHWQSLHDEGRAVGVLIEVEYMELTKNNKFRHPRFIRIRDDKEEENLGQ